ncbi:AlbA family DNA-binding domain-containing protein [Prescottella equi]|uniref:AlbA family DNA-binding domain-containing protein n=1 Tax=Rhodococcus hoagii TaxID=43767 RepID=UPI002741ED07|nr:ATP-binding protein [Prescottella equi]MDP8017648.1 ATP-binding protein [Prescottella equi]
MTRTLYISRKLEREAITEAGLRKLVEEIPVENEFVEYKSRGEFEKPATPKSKQERGKDVSAPANGRGAILIYGIEDDKKSSVIEERMRPFDNAADAHKLIEQFRKDIRQYVAPTPLFDMFAVAAAAGGFYLVLVVPPSVGAPHAVTAGPGQERQTFSYFIRSAGETHIRTLGEHEVADRYSIRHRRQEDRARHAAAVWTEGRSELTPFGRAPVWLAVAVVPDVLVDGQLTPQVRDEIEAWDNSQLFPDSILGHRPPVRDYPFPAPGKMVYSALAQEDGAQPDPKAVDSYRELHADGSAYAALLMGEEFRAGYVPLDPDDLVDVIVSLVSHTLGWATARAGRWGNASVQIGFVVGSNRGWSPGLELTGSGGVSVHALRRTRNHKSATTVADLASLHTTQDMLRVAYSAALPMLQIFGVIQPAWITEDGEIRKPLLLQEFRRRALEWAEVRGVGIEDSF